MPPAFNLSHDQTLQFKFLIAYGYQSWLAGIIFALRLIAQMSLHGYSHRANVQRSLTRIPTHIVLLIC